MMDAFHIQLLERLAGDVLPGVVQKGLQTYVVITLIGFGLMMAAVIGALLFRRKRRTG